MAFPEDLLEQAEHLARREPRRPKQASLRRAISTAYYSLFHLLISEATSNWKRSAQRNSLARVFDHGLMKRACDRKRKELETQLDRSPDALIVKSLFTVTDSFVRLQQQRHLADYDNDRPWSRREALAQVKAARDAFQCWNAIRNDDLAQDFLISLLLRDR